MGDEKFSDEVRATAREIVMLAVGAAGPLTDRRQWRTKVRAMVAEITGMIGPESDMSTFACRLQESKRFRVRILPEEQWEFDDNAQRWIVKVFSETADSDDQTEEFRTERVDRAEGREQVELLRSHIDGEGIAWVYLAPHSSNTKRSVRVLQHFVPFGRAPQQSQDRRNTAQTGDRRQTVRQDQEDGWDWQEGLTVPERLAVAKEVRARTGEGPSARHRAIVEQVVAEMRAPGLDERQIADAFGAGE